MCDVLCMQDVMMLTFTPKTTGMTWKDYLDLYCAGAKQLFMHETPKHPLQFGPALEAKASSEASPCAQLACKARAGQLQAGPFEPMQRDSIVIS